jgi:transposase
MQVMHPRCAGLDLGKDMLVAAVRLQEGSEIQKECRTFRTTSRELLALSSWMESQGVTHVVMEATGSYWKSVWHVLEGQFELMLANPTQVRNLPGRKSDVNDSTWLADLLAHGLIRGSFVPPAPIDALRELTRTRKQFVREIARHTQRIQKILDIANLKLTGTISDVLGASGRAIVKALIAGETDPFRLAALVNNRIKATRGQLVEALDGRLTVQQRHLLSMHLNLIETLEASIEQLDHEIEKAVDPFRDLVDLIKEVPGLSQVGVPALLGEIGVDMTKFKTHRHIVSWARICPRLDESAGKVHSTRTQKGSVWIKTLLIQAAWAATRSKNSYLHAQFLRLRARRGAKKAIVAVAASILVSVYYIIRDRKPYKDLGVHYFTQHDRVRTARRPVARLKNLGYNVQVSQAVA